MSHISFGKIISGRNSKQPSRYVGIFIETNSGLGKPVIVSSTKEYVSIYGTNIPREVKWLLQNKIPVLTIPQLSEFCFTNRANAEVTLKEGKLISYSVPSGRFIDYYDKSFPAKVDLPPYRGDSDNNIILEYSEIPKDSYIILQVLKGEKIKRVLFNKGNTQEVTSEHFEEIVEVSGSYKEAISNYSSEMKVLDLQDLIKTDLLGEFSILPELEDVVERLNQDFRYLKSIGESTSDIKSANLLFDVFPRVQDLVYSIGDRILGCNLIREFRSSLESLLEISLECTQDYDRISTISGVDIISLTEEGFILNREALTEIIVDLSVGISLQKQYLVIIYPDSVPLCLGTNIQGRVFTSKELSGQINADLNKKEKSYSILAKKVGVVGNGIKVTIERVEDSLFLLSIKSDDSSEYYKVWTDTPVEGYLSLKEVSERSHLISFKVYDYLIDTEKVDGSTIESSEYIESREVPISLLPRGVGEATVVLNGAIETYTKLSKLRTLQILSEFEYFPTFVLHSIEDDSELSKIFLGKLYRFIESHYSQGILLISNKEELLRSIGVLNEDYQSLLFFGRFLNKLPSYLPFVRSLMESKCSLDFIGLPHILKEEDDYFLDLTDSIESELKEAKINYLRFDNNKYYYANLRELSDKPYFIVKFVLNNLSRVLFEHKHQLIAHTTYDLVNKIDDIVSEFESDIKLVKGTTYTYTANVHELKITFSITIPVLSIKDYKVNFNILN